MQLMRVDVLRACSYGEITHLCKEMDACCCFDQRLAIPCDDDVSWVGPATSASAP